MNPLRMMSLALVLGVLPIQAALIHRYSFAGDATDSVGTAHGTLVGGATVSNGQVVLDGVDGYVDLPNDLFTNFTSITFETWRSEEHTSELQSLTDISYAVFCLKKKKKKT